VKKTIKTIIRLIFLTYLIAGCAPSNINNIENTQTEVFVLPKMRDANLTSPTLDLDEFPKRVALLLPLSGEYKREGESVLIGFLSAHYSLMSSNQKIQSINVYDTQSYDSAKDAYDQAVNEGAEFIVGPLLQDSVSELSEKIAFNVPVLALNSNQNNEVYTIGMYQFSLSSLDEVISTSNKVISDGNNLGAIIMPNNELGRDLRDIYKSTFESMGGMILDDQFYNPDNQDFSDELKALLIIDNSENRYRRLSANLGEFIAFEPRRRQDIDFIFLLATDTTNAKLLKSQLDYHLSGDDPIPIYSTSNIFSLRENMDDLDGVIFTDAPWVIDQQSWLKDLPTKLMKFWPGDAIQSRQNAMGYDAYFLTSKLAKQNNSYLKEFNGATGQLYMDSENKIRRRLAWAKLIDGKTEVSE
jgi:outer membrane PBP1 activator LpoA protein